MNDQTASTQGQIALDDARFMMLSDRLTYTVVQTRLCEAWSRETTRVVMEILRGDEPTWPIHDQKFNDLNHMAGGEPARAGPDPITFLRGDRPAGHAGPGIRPGERPDTGSLLVAPHAASVVHRPHRT